MNNQQIMNVAYARMFVNEIPYQRISKQLLEDIINDKREWSHAKLKFATHEQVIVYHIDHNQQIFEIYRMDGTLDQFIDDLNKSVCEVQNYMKQTDKYTADVLAQLKNIKKYHDIDCDKIDGVTLEQLQKEIQSLITQYGNDSKIIFDAGANNIMATIECIKKESYDAYMRRTEIINNQKLLTEKKERKLYEELKAKYGN